MYDLLSGVRVLELAAWLFVPTAGTVLAEWGAEVIKVEHPVTGDPVRGLSNAVTRAATVNLHVEQTGRGKRSIGLDVSTPDGRAVLDRLVDSADVFLTSFTERTRQANHIDVDDICGRNPSIIYVRGTGHGPRGPDAQLGGFDMASTWARSGLAFQMTPPGGEPPMQPASIGDLSSGLTMAGAVAAALFRRERTGKGGVVDMSLYSMGMWMMSQLIGASAQGNADNVWGWRDRTNPHNPIVNYFPTKDGRWILLNMLQADRWWPDLCAHLGRPDLVDDTRFATNAARVANLAETTKTLDEIFLTRTLEEWRTALATAEGVWAPVLSPLEVGQDPQVDAMGYFPEVRALSGEEYRAVAAPAQFDDRPIGELRHAPEFGQHTEEVLLELEYGWDDITRLKDQGAIL
jgi:crotonobetainyl-CoA:carnitine CoA-transferase CaiB-like acyl-CoA transferase